MDTSSIEQEIAANEKQLRQSYSVKVRLMDEIDSLEEASALRDIAHMPARVKCAVLGWRTLKEALLGEDADDDEDDEDW